MRVTIVDVEWYNKSSFTPNITCMKLSSYHQQLGDLVTLANDEFDIKMDFDIMYVIREKISGSLPPGVKVRDKKVNLIGPGFKFYDRYMAELPAVVAACRPDYLLYPIKEENKVSKADMVQFYSKGERLKLIQDYTNAYKKSKFVYVVDKDFWSKNVEDIKACLEILKKNGNKNIIFKEGISLKAVVYNPEVRELFLSVDFMKESLINFINDCEAQQYEDVIQFLVDFAKTHNNKFPPIHFKSITFDHNKYPHLVIDEIERCIRMIVDGKKVGVQIYIDAPPRKDTPFWYYFEELEFWCKHQHKQSFVEHMLTTASKMHRTSIYNVMQHKLMWSSVQAELLKDLYRKRPEMIDKYGWIQWEDLTFPFYDLTQVIGGK